MILLDGCSSVPERGGILILTIEIRRQRLYLHVMSRTVTVPQRLAGTVDGFAASVVLIAHEPQMRPRERISDRRAIRGFPPYVIVCREATPSHPGDDVLVFIVERLSSTPGGWRDFCYR